MRRWPHPGHCDAARPPRPCTLCTHTTHLMKTPRQARCLAQIITEISGKPRKLGLLRGKEEIWRMKPDIFSDAFFVMRRGECNDQCSSVPAASSQRNCASVSPPATPHNNIMIKSYLLGWMLLSSGVCVHRRFGQVKIICRYWYHNGRYYSIRATCIVKFWFFHKNHSGPFIHITWYHLNCLKTSKGAPFRGF